MPSEKVKAFVYDFTGRLSFPQAGSPILCLPSLCRTPPHHLRLSAGPRGNHSRRLGTCAPSSREGLPPCQLQRNEMPAGMACLWAGGQGQGREPLAAPPHDISQPARPLQPQLRTC
jgi:hypothetical protein